MQNSYKIKLRINKYPEYTPSVDGKSTSSECKLSLWLEEILLAGGSGSLPRKGIWPFGQMPFVCLAHHTLKRLCCCIHPLRPLHQRCKQPQLRGILVAQIFRKPLPGHDPSALLIRQRSNHAIRCLNHRRQARGRSRQLINRADCLPEN